MICIYVHVAKRSKSLSPVQGYLLPFELFQPRQRFVSQFELFQPRQRFVSQPLDDYDDDSVWGIRESDTVFQSETVTVGRFFYI